MSFEPHYINAYIIYCMICMIFTLLILDIYNKLVAHHFTDPIPP